MYQVTKQFAQCTIYKGRKFDIGPFRTFAQARRECQEWLDADHEQLDHPAGRAPRGIGPKHAVTDGDATYSISADQRTVHVGFRVTPEERDALQQAADEAGVKLGQYIRRRLLG